jgi:type 1 glutamine amidotransferase
MLGSRYDEHPWNQTEAKVVVTDPKFPGLGNLGSSFEIKDEFYQLKDFNAAESRVLLRLDTSNLDMTKRGVNPADYPWPLAYAKMYGKGRVFYASFAHAPATWDDPKVQDMYLGAIKWALGLVDADVTPIPMPPPPQAPHP